MDQTLLNFKNMNINNKHKIEINKWKFTIIIPNII